MADVTERLPYAISKKMASTVDTVLARNGREIDYTVAGIPFRLRISDDTPLTYETAPMQKAQQDVEPEAGEQTLTGWWLRSQASFHDGAGSKYPESSIGQSLRVAPTAAFWDSRNVDVWTRGRVTLLPAAESLASAGITAVSATPTDSNVVVVGTSGAVRKYTSLSAGTITDLYVGAGVTFNEIITTDTQWYAAGNDGRIYRGLISTLTTGPDTWSLTGADTTKATRIFWAKHRLWAVNGNKIYVVNSTTPGTTAAPTATASIYNHPSTSWQYTDICDAPGGALFSGYGDGTSCLQVVGLATDGSVPTLSGARTTAVLPSDEKALRISSLTGSLICILTTRGIRAASALTNGELSYGPLFLTRTTPVPTSARPALTAAGRFWWMTWGDEAMCYRIDSSVQPEDGVFAYATDMNLPAATPFCDITVSGDRPVVATTGGAVVRQHATQLEPTGWIQCGRVRFRTEEPKLFEFIDVSAAPLAGKLALDVVNEADSETRVLTWDTPGMGTLPTARVSTELGPQRFISVKLTLTRATNLTSGPEIHGWQVKALPGGKPQRIYTLPFYCYDREKWWSGQEDPEGYDGYARDRYYSLRKAEDTGGIVMLRDYRFPSPLGELCKIESMKFIQLKRGNPDKMYGGSGGILMVTLRTLT